LTEVVVLIWFIYFDIININDDTERLERLAWGGWICR